MPGKVALEFQGAVAVMTIENNGRLNAMDDKVASGLASGVIEAKARGDVGALVIRGAGRDAFCAGVDLKFVAEFPDRAAGFARVGANLDKFHATMAELPFPSIALIHGVCYGGGLHLAVTCDFRFAATSLRMVVPAVKNGLLYPIPALERLMALVGPARTRRLVLEGALFPPERLLQWGLIDELYAPDALDAATLEFAARLAAQPRAVMPAYMKILRAVEAGDIAGAQRLREETRRATGKPDQG
ncbi:MAG TPA: enoyl-CoA hydratase/isomerase family protein [Stellaceae bacterium]|nr:enoyl-CoA hydratase/isomerase family protein [Stellaceae bacterium]